MSVVVKPDSETWSATPDALATRRVHFVGIGGAGMSGLARLFRRLGATCSGSDLVRSPLTRAMEAAGIDIRYDQTAGHVPECTDLVIASAAIRPDHAEWRAAAGRGIELISYAEALGRVQAASTGISIAGTHGKSTTTAMLCHALIEGGLDPSFIVGAECEQIGGGSRIGARTVPNGPWTDRPGLLVAEACEFNRSFHHHRPIAALINNIEEDHLDVYGDLAHVVEAFARFASLLPPREEGGFLLIAHDGAHRREVTGGLNCEVATFGFNPAADFHVTSDAQRGVVEVRRAGTLLGSWTNQMPGEHNASNAAAAGILATRMGAEWSTVAPALGRFRGLCRRMERLGICATPGGEVVVYDDYGHHPTEVDATLRALRAAERPKRLICVFQPHQHSRTRFLLAQFAQSFSAADVVIVPHIYFVRDSEIEMQRVSAVDLVQQLRDRGVRAMHLDPFEAIVEQLQVMCRGGDLVVIMGAGPVDRIAREFMAAGTS